jgi:bacterioferritin
MVLAKHGNAGMSCADERKRMATPKGRIPMARMDVSEPQTVAIEIQLKTPGLSMEAFDARTRRLAESLRLLPHNSVRIIAEQVPSPNNQSPVERTEGTITSSLPAATLSAVITLLLKDPGFILKGPNGSTLDFSTPVPQDEIDVWLKAAGKESIVQREIEQHREPAADKVMLPSLEELRAHARHHIESGAVTEEYKADRQQVLEVLNQVLATELVCILRYKSHYHRASGVNAQLVKVEFLEHAKEAQQHADLVATRIVQLNGAPEFNPEGLTRRSRTEFTSGGTLNAMIKEDLIAERIAVEFYSAIVRWLGDLDLTTRKVMQEILAVEVQHAEDMKLLLGRLTPGQTS